MLPPKRYFEKLLESSQIKAGQILFPKLEVGGFNKKERGPEVWISAMNLLFATAQKTDDLIPVYSQGDTRLLPVILTHDVIVQQRLVGVILKPQEAQIAQFGPMFNARISR